MRNSQNHKKHVSYFLNGADYDINNELAALKQGFYKDARNMRLYTKGNVVRRIYGETLKYYTLAKAYTCIGAIEVNGNVVEVWVSDNTTSNNVWFRINGVVMVETTKLGFTKSNKLQMDKADDCKEGLFFITDNNVTPYIFSLKDIQDNHTAGTTKYTTSFNPLLYSVNLNIQPNIPVFRSLVDGTLDVGKYAYAIRFVDKDGNRTKFSLPTPMIPVPLNYEKGSNAHPYNSTYGGLLEKSTYGIRIDFRINNKLNYEYIELLRIKSITMQALDEVQEAEFRPLIPILTDGEVSVRTFEDDGSYTDWQSLTDEESTDTMAAIKRCKALRYYNNQLVLANVEVASSDIQDQVTFTEYLGEKAFPFIDNLGEVGYYSPHNSAYKTSYMGGEKYGFGIVCLDWQNNVAFVIPVYDTTVDLRNYQFPDRREQLGGATYDLSVNNWKGAPKAADINGNDDVYVHEKFEKGIIKKSNQNSRTIFSTGYDPYTPKYPNDSDVNGLGIKPNSAVASVISSTSGTTATVHYYDPNYSLNYYGMGIAIAGIENLPDWVAAFCVVRTKPAGRVLCQGISAYSLNYNNILEYNKILNQTEFFSDDIAAGITFYQENMFNDMKFYPVSPLGYFTELYSGHRPSSYTQCCDMLMYARDFYTDPNDDASKNLLPFSGALQKYWTKFGVWRNDTADIFNPNTKTFEIQSDTYKQFKNIGQDSFLRLVLNDNLYIHQTPQVLGATMDCNNVDTRNWHEPFYIANIIDDNKNVPDINQQEYILTGHYQKIESIIGVGNDKEQSFILVDERFEDCCVNQNALASATYRPAYIYMRDPNTGIDKAWVDITVCANTPTNYAATVIAALQATGTYTSTDPITGDSVTCYGAYTHTISSNIVETGDWTIVFDEIVTLDKKYCIPADNSEIIIKYDTRFPIKAFGGDVTIGESNFAWVDGQTNTNGGAGVSAFIPVGMPYSAYALKDRVGSALANTQLPAEYIQIQGVRQAVISAVVESRANLCYSYQVKSTSTVHSRATNLPRQHYVLRPYKWDATTIQNNFSGSGGYINNQYLNDYPLEYTYWKRGGIRCYQAINRDYSKANNYNRLFGKPQVGFEEKTYFCTRHIWSLKRNINVQDDPNLKTFLSLNFFDISDRNGEVKYLYDNDSGKGNNLISLTDNGICLLLTDKRTISDVNSNELFVLDADSLIKGEYWLSKTVGCSGEFWRGIAEYNNVIFIPNAESIYMMAGLEIKDILRFNQGSYYDKVHPVLQAATNTVPMTAVFNIDNQEYWLYIGEEVLVSPYDGSETIGGVDSDLLTPKKLSQSGLLDSQLTPTIRTPKNYTGSTYVYKLDKDVFTGTFDYRGDKFLCKQGRNNSKNLVVLLMRNYETYETNLGNSINGAAIEGELEYVAAPEGHILKEFIDATINSSLIPTSVDLRTTGTTAEATQTYFKNYAGFYFQTPRKTVTGYRMQGKHLVLTVKNNATGLFEVVSVEHGYKIIK